MEKRRGRIIIRVAALCLIWIFSLTQVILIVPTQAFAGDLLGLPSPGAMVTLSPGFVPLLLKGVKIFPNNPLRFDFIVDSGDSGLNEEGLKAESGKLVKYFLASLTIPEDDLWVNLSPYEKDRIIPDEFGVTEMGRDLLTQDYLLKQITASLLYPEDPLGRKFWDRVHKKARELYGATDIPVNTFNKVWIVPEKAVVYTRGDTAYVVESRLKVMLEADYLTLKENLNNKGLGTDRLASGDVTQLNDVSSAVVKEVILPEIEKEVNEGRNFAALRQIYHSLILATWFKRNFRNSFLGRKYVEQKKVSGVDVEDKAIREKIYRQYLAAFKKGVYNFIKEDFDPDSQETIPRKYFSGGVTLLAMTKDAYTEQRVPPPAESLSSSAVQLISVDLAPKIDTSDKVKAGLKPLVKDTGISTDSDTNPTTAASPLEISDEPVYLEDWPGDPEANLVIDARKVEPLPRQVYFRIRRAVFTEDARLPFYLSKKGDIDIIWLEYRNGRLMVTSDKAKYWQERERLKSQGMNAMNMRIGADVNTTPLIPGEVLEIGRAATGLGEFQLREKLQEKGLRYKRHTMEAATPAVSRRHLYMFIEEKTGDLIIIDASKFGTFLPGSQLDDLRQKILASLPKKSGEEIIADNLPIIYGADNIYGEITIQPNQPVAIEGAVDPEGKILALSPFSRELTEIIAKGHPGVKKWYQFTMNVMPGVFLPYLKEEATHYALSSFAEDTPAEALQRLRDSIAEADRASKEQFREGAQFFPDEERLLVALVQRLRGESDSLLLKTLTDKDSPLEIGPFVGEYKKAREEGGEKLAGAAAYLEALLRPPPKEHRDYFAGGMSPMNSLSESLRARYALEKAVETDTEITEIIVQKIGKRDITVGIDEISGPDNLVRDVRASISDGIKSRGSRSLLKLRMGLDKGRRIFSLSSEGKIHPYDAEDPGRYQRILDTVAIAMGLLFNDDAVFQEKLRSEAAAKGELWTAVGYHRFRFVNAAEVLGTMDKGPLPQEARAFFSERAPDGRPQIERYIDSDFIRDVLVELGGKTDRSTDLTALLRRYLLLAYEFETAPSITVLKETLRKLIYEYRSYKFSKIVDLGRAKVYSEKDRRWYLDEKRPIQELDPDTFEVVKAGQTGTPEGFMRYVKSQPNPESKFYVYNHVCRGHNRLWLLASRNGRFELFYTSETYSSVAGQYQWSRQEAAVAVATTAGGVQVLWYGKPRVESSHDMPEAASQAVNALLPGGVSPQLSLFAEDSNEWEEVSRLHLLLGLAYSPDGVLISTNPETGKAQYGNKAGIKIDEDRYPRWHDIAGEEWDRVLGSYRREQVPADFIDKVNENMREGKETRPQKPSSDNLALINQEDKTGRKLSSPLSPGETNNSSPDYGGIDLNPNIVEIQTRGPGVEIKLPPELQDLENIPINGFTPVIFQIIPLPNAQIFLGLDAPQPSGELVRTH